MGKGYPLKGSEAKTALVIGIESSGQKTKKKEKRKERKEKRQKVAKLGNRCFKSCSWSCGGGGTGKRCQRAVFSCRAHKGAGLQDAKCFSLAVPRDPSRPFKAEHDENLYRRPNKKIFLGGPLSLPSLCVCCGSLLRVFHYCPLPRRFCKDLLRLV